MTGSFIVFEGGEGSGKSTQLRLIRDWLTDRGLLVMVTREPGGTKLGKELRQILLNYQAGESIANRTELLIFAADRAQHIETVVKPHLAAGAIVLCDRFTDSTVAYQGYGRGIPIDLITEINQLATCGLTPDLTLWLDVDVEIGLGRVNLRGEHDRIENLDLEFHQRVRSGYRDLAAVNPRIIQIDANQSVDIVSDRIKQILSSVYGD